MSDSPFSDRTSLTVAAIYIGERIDTRTLEVGEKIVDLPLMTRAGERGAAVIYRWGAIVLFDVSPVEQAGFVKHLRPFVTEAIERPQTEMARIHIEAVDQEKTENGVLTLKDASIPRLLAVGDILAKSVVLAHYEMSIAAAIELVEPLAESLQRGEGGGIHGRQLLKHIGGVLLIQNRMVGRVEVGEKPEFLWDRPDVERLYVRLEDEYELAERHRALERKLELISRTAETLLQLAQDARTLRVEWYVVALIVFEILLTLFDMFVRHRT